MAKKRTKEQYAAHATKQRERDAKRREDPAEREKDRIRMKEQRKRNQGRVQTEEWKANKRERDRINQANRRARLKAEAEARKEKEVDGVARLDVGGDGVDTGGQAMNMNMETPCRPPAMKRRRCLNTEFGGETDSEGSAANTGRQTKKERPKKETNQTRISTCGQVQRAIKRSRFPRISLIVNKKRFRVVNGKVRLNKVPREEQGNERNEPVLTEGEESDDEVQFNFKQRGNTDRSILTGSTVNGVVEVAYGQPGGEKTSAKIPYMGVLGLIRSNGLGAAVKGSYQ